MSDTQQLVLRIDGDSQGARNAISSLVEQLTKFGAVVGAPTAGVEGLTSKLIVATTVGNVFGNVLTNALTKVYDGIKNTVTALPDLVARVAEAGDHIWVMSAQTGVSAEALSKLDYVASQTGTSLETITGIIFMMSRRLGENTAATSTALRQLGLSVSEVTAMKPEEAFLKIVSSIGKVPDATTRAQVGMAIFGRQYRSIAQLVGQDMDGLMKKAEEMGLVTTKAQADMANSFTDAEDDLHRAFQGIEQQVGYALMPAFTKAIEGIAMALVKFTHQLNINTAEWAKFAEEGADRIIKAFEALLAVALPLVKVAIEALIFAMRTAIEVFLFAASVVAGVAKTIQAAWDFLPDWAKTLVTRFGELAVAAYLLRDALNALSTAQTINSLKSTAGGIMSMVSNAREFITYAREFGLEALELIGPLSTLAKVAMGAGAALGFLAVDFAPALALGDESLKDFQKDVQFALTGVRPLAEGLKDIALESTNAADPLLGLALALKTGTTELWAQSSLSVAASERTKRLADDAKSHGVNVAWATQQLIHNKVAFTDWATTVAKLSPELMTYLNDLAQKETTSTDTVRSMAVEAEKARVNATERGLTARLKLADLDASESQRKLKQQLDTQAITDEEYHQLSAAQASVNAAKKKEILLTNERETADAIQDLHVKAEQAVLHATQEGMDAQKAAVTDAAEQEITTKQRTIGTNKAAIEQFDLWAQARREQATAELTAIDMKAELDAAKKVRDVRFSTEETRIKLAQTGTDQELALLDIETKRKIAALDDRKLADAAYQAELSVITEEGENKRADIEDKALRTRLTADAAHERARLELTTTGLQKALALENLNFTEKTRLLSKESDEYRQAAREHADAIAKAIADENKYTGNLLVDITNRGYMTKDEAHRRLAIEQKMLADMLAHEKDFTADVLNEQRKRVHDAEVAAGSITAKFKDHMDGMNDIFKSAFEGGGGVKGAVESFSTGLLKEGLKAIPIVGETLSHFAGAMVAGVKRLFGGASKQELEGRSAEKAFQDTFGGFDKMLGSIAATYQLTGKTADQARADVERLMAAEKKGGDAVKGVIAEIQAQFDLQKKAAEDLPKETEKVTSGLNAIANATFGPALKAWDAYIQKIGGDDVWKRDAENVSKNFAEGFTVPTQAAVDRLGRLTTTAFHAAIASGMSFTDAIKAIGPALDQTNAAVNKFGGLTTGAFSSLLKVREFTQANQELMDGLDGTNKMMSGLHMMGLLTQEDFNDLTAIATDTYKKMTDGGLSGTDAMRAMQPTLQEIWIQHHENGMAIDDNTAKLLDQAETQGLVGEKMKSVQQQTLDVLKAIAKVLGADIPDALNKLPKDTTLNVHLNADHTGDWSGAGGGAETEPIPSFANRPLERVTGAGWALLHPGDVVGVPHAGVGGMSISIDASGSIFKDRAAMRDLAHEVATQISDSVRRVTPLGLRS